MKLSRRDFLIAAGMVALDPAGALASYASGGREHLYEFRPGKTVVTGIVSVRGNSYRHFIHEAQRRFGRRYDIDAITTGGYSTWHRGRLCPVGKVVINARDVSPESYDIGSSVMYDSGILSLCRFDNLNSEYRRGGMVGLLPHLETRGRGGAKPGARRPKRWMIWAARPRFQATAEEHVSSTTACGTGFTQNPTRCCRTSPYI